MLSQGSGVTTITAQFVFIDTNELLSYCTLIGIQFATKNNYKISNFRSHARPLHAKLCTYSNLMLLS